MFFRYSSAVYKTDVNLRCTAYKYLVLTSERTLMLLERAVSQSCVGRSLLFILRIVHGVDRTQNFKLLNLALPKVTTRLYRINFVELATKRKIIVVYISQRNCSVRFFENVFARAWSFIMACCQVLPIYCVS